MNSIDILRARIIAESAPPHPLRWRGYRLLLRGMKMLRMAGVAKFQ